MAKEGPTVLDCTYDGANRGDAMMHVQHLLQQVLMSRKQFTVTRSVDADGAFEITISGNGQDVLPVVPEAEPEPKPKATTRVRRSNKAKVDSQSGD